MRRLFFAGLIFFFGFASAPVSAETLSQRLSGAILLQVEEHGEGWYVYPENLQRYYLGRPDDAFAIMRNLGLGISNADLALIPEQGAGSTGNVSLRQRLSGYILLQVEANGEAWYVYPDTMQRYYLGRPDDAYHVMRELGLGISNENLLSISVSPDSSTPPNGGNRSDGQATVGTLNDGHTQTRLSVLNSLNEERGARSLPAFSLIKEISVSAQTHADDMSASQYFSFESPEGIEIKDRLETAGYVPYTVAQNLIQTTQPAAQVVEIWKEKQDISYNNVIAEQYEDVGVGVGTYQGTPFYLVVFTRSLESFFVEQTASLADLGIVRDSMLSRVNQERAERGLSTLAINSLLNSSAQGHADDMFARAYYAHETPEGINPHQRIIAADYNAIKSGENIAKGQFTVEQVMDAWVNSPDHLANLLGDFEEIGFGLAYGESQSGYEIYWVQNFGSR